MPAASNRGSELPEQNSKIPRRTAGTKDAMSRNLGYRWTVVDFDAIYRPFETSTRPLAIPSRPQGGPNA